MAVTMQEEDPAGWEQMWESWISPPPHICPQLVSFTKLNPTWCNRFGSMVSRQDRTQSVPTFHDCFHICSVLFFAVSNINWVVPPKNQLIRQSTSLFGSSQSRNPHGAYWDGLCQQRDRSGHFLLLWMETTFSFR